MVLLLLPLAPITTGIIIHFMFQIRSNSRHKLLLLLLYMRIWSSYIQCPAERAIRSQTGGTRLQLHGRTATDDVVCSTAPGSTLRRTADINCHVKTDND
jgi:hypothetical protein